jgi:hypothetical protein
MNSNSNPNSHSGYPHASVHIFALFAFAVVQPLLDVLSHHPTFFIARESQPIDILLMLAILSLGIPLLLVLCELLVGRISPRGRNGFHIALVSLLLFVICLPPATKQLGPELQLLLILLVDDPSSAVVDAAIFLTTLLISIGLVYFYKRYQLARTFVTLLGAGIVLFPAWFLFQQPVRDVVFPKDAPTAPLAVEIENRAPVIFVVFDELNGMSLLDEHREIDPVRYPNFAKFSSEATWFRNATTSDASTEHAVPTLLTGKQPDHAKLPQRSDHPNNLFALLQGTHHQTVRELTTSLSLPDSNVVLVPAPARLWRLMTDVAVIFGQVIVPESQKRLLPGVAGQWGNFLNRQIGSHGRLGEFRSFLRSIVPATQPVLHFHHCKLPHVTYEYLPSGRAYRGPLITQTIGLKHTWQADELAILHSQQRYLLQLGCVDRLVGELVDRLKAVELYDHSLIILVSDHGVAYTPGELRREIYDANAQEIMPILMMIKSPFQRTGAISDRNVESLDMLPTIADVLGVQVPWRMDGQSALDLSLPERAEKVCWSRDHREVRDAAFDEKYTGLERNLKHFGTGADPHGLYRIGPFSDGIGRPVAEFDVNGTPQLDAFIEYLVDIDPTISAKRVTVPCYLRGRIAADSQAKLPVKLAIAVNGVIRAATRTYRLPGYERIWRAMLPEEVFLEETLKLELFVISSSGGKVSLTPVNLLDDSDSDARAAR